MFVVYVLVSATTGKRYMGQTDDLARRLAEHNDSHANSEKFTSKQAGPWQLVYSENYPTRSDAMRREKWLKSSAGR